MKPHVFAPSWIVTAAWPYVNAPPHLGSILHLLTGDVITRYLRLRGENVVYVSGSDAHGTPILVAAQQTERTPQELATHYHQQYLKLIHRWHIHLDNYTITHNPTHIAFCQAFYHQLDYSGFIKPVTSPQLYCSHCQRFLPDRFVQGTCPYCDTPHVRGDECTNPTCGHLLTPTDLINPYCSTCGTLPTSKDTTHWYFDLPRFSWGIPVDSIFENAHGKVLYVWAEAVLGYVSATQEWAINQGTPQVWKQMWQCPDTKTIFCIGKDNILFHSIIFPALLLAHPEPYVLPYAITVTEFYTFEGQPFSKSKGIGIDAVEALNVAPADCWRYFLLINRPETKDFDFTWNGFIETINHDLNNTLGNFIYRTLNFIYHNFNKKIPPCGQLNNEDHELLSSIQAIAQRQAQYFDDFKIRDALAIVLSLAQAGNVYLSTYEPWKKLNQDRVFVSTKYYAAVQVVNALAILLYPFLPHTAQKIRSQLKLSTTINVDEFTHIANTRLPSEHRIQKPTILFTKLQKRTILRAGEA